MALTRIRAQQISNIDYKQAVRVVTTSNITLSGGAPSTADGVALSANSRILVNGQTTQTQNGLYLVQTVGTGSNGTWVRTTDTDVTGEMQSGMVVTVTEGNTYRDTLWTLITDDPIVVGSSNITFQQSTSFNFGNITANGTAILANTVGDAVTFTAGNNIAITGNATTKTVTFGVTGIQSTQIVNGTSNVAIATANGNVTVSVNGTSNVAVFTATGANITGAIETSGNITGAYFIGNGSQLAGLPEQYGNSNVAAYLPTYTGNIGAGNITATGNVTGNYFLGNGSQLSGIITSVANINNGASNVSIDSANANVTVGVNGVGNLAVFSSLGITVAGNVLPSANVTYSLGSTTQRWKDIWVANSTIYLGETPLTTTGNTLVVNGLNVITSTNTDSLLLTGNITGGNLLTNGIVSATGSITGSSVVGGVITGSSTSVTGTTTAASVVGGVITGTSTSVTGTTTAASVVGGVITGSSTSVTGNITGGNFTTAGTISVGGITLNGNLIVGEGPTLTIDPNGSGGTDGNVVITGNLTVNGTTTTINSNTITTNDLQINMANNAANATAANNGGIGVGPAGAEYATFLYNTASNVWVSSLGISSVGNITGGNLSGASIAGTLTTAAQPNITSVGTLSSASVGGNVQGGNILTAGLVSATGSITGASVVGGVITGTSTSVTGTTTAASVVGGVITGSSTSVTGTTTAASVVGGVITGTSTSVTGTTTAVSVVGGVMTGTSVSASGNVTGGNLITMGVVSATGNITGNYFFGNGSQLTGISAGGGGIEWTTSATAPPGPNPGDFWYDTDDDKTYQYVNDGVGNAWVDQSAPTSFGNLTVGNILNGGANGSGNIGSATGYFNTTFSTNGTFVNLSGNGAALTAINASNISSGTLSQARLANAAVTLGSTALTLGATVTTVAGLSSVTSTTFVGALTGAATTAGTVTTAAQPNITSTGTLSSLTMGGLLTGYSSTNTDVNTANDGGSFSARGNASTIASMTFHRTGAYAINMGLGTDNIFRIGGWSASANCMQLSGAGAMTILSSLTLNSAGGATAIVNGGSNGVGNIGSSTTYFNTVFAKATSAQYADLAENYLADCCYEPGTVVIFGGNAEVSVSSVSHDPRVAGVVSTNPSYLMNAALTGPTVSAVALTGRVPCWVQGPVSKGDRIVNAGTGIGGRLDRSAYEPGCIVGKSLEDIVDNSVRLIEVVIGRF